MLKVMNPAPTDEAGTMALTKKDLSKLARSLRRPETPQTSTAARVPSGAVMPSIDPALLPAALGDVQVPGGRRMMPAMATRDRLQAVPTTRARSETMAIWAAGTVTVGLLLAASTGAAAIAWKSYGDKAEQMIAQWTPRRLLASVLPLQNPGAPAQPPASAALAVPPAASTPVEVSVMNQAPSQPGSAGQTESEAAVPAALPSVTALPPVDSAQSLDSMANDIASARQEIEQLKAGQQQLSRNMALAFETIASVRADKASAQNQRTNTSGQTWHSASAPVRRTMPPLPDPVPRPPMPLR
jgi:hypothetical protein